MYEIKVSVKGTACEREDCRSWQGTSYTVYGEMLCYVIAESQKEAEERALGYDFAGDFGEIGWDSVESVIIDEIEYIGDATATDEEEFEITDTGLDDGYDEYNDCDDRYEMDKIREYLG